MFEAGEKALWTSHGRTRPVTIIRRARLMGYWGEHGRIVDLEDGTDYKLAKVDELSAVPAVSEKAST